MIRSTLCWISRVKCVVVLSGVIAVESRGLVSPASGLNVYRLGSSRRLGHDDHEIVL